MSPVRSRWAERVHARLLAAFAAAAFAACGDDESAAGGPVAPGAQQTAGGESDDLSYTAMAKTVAKREPQAAAADAKKPALAPSSLPTAKPLPQLVAVQADDGSSGQGQWGAAESCPPMPKRAQLAGAAGEAYKQGLAALSAGQLPQAKQAFKNASAADARAYQAHYGLGVIADREGFPDEALAHYGKALALAPDYELAVQGTVNVMLRRGSADSAVGFVKPIADKWTTNLFLYAILADVLTRADRVDEAEQVARKALRCDERFVPAIVSLAKASQRRGRKELADATLVQAAEIDRNYAEIHFLQGQIWKDKGELAQALPALRKAVELRPEYAEARMALGIQYMASGNYNEALEQFEASARLVPTLVAAHLNLGDAYRALKRWQDAKRELDKALRMQADLPQAHFNLALMYMSAGAEFPSLSELDALDRSLVEFTTYRTQLGPKLASDDPSAAYMADIQRRIEREKKRIEREKARAEKEAQRKARGAEEASKPAGAAPEGN